MPAPSAPYVDLYLLPVPTAQLAAYEAQAAAFGAVVRELGALSYRELLGDDLGEALAVEEGVTLTAAVAEFRSREHRDEVMAAVMADPRVEALLTSGPVGEMEEMRYGGFRPFVEA